jgi:hypothetical protein
VDDVGLANRMLRAIIGHRLLAFRMSLGSGVLLEFTDDACHELTIEAELRFRSADGPARRGDPIGLVVAEQLIRLLEATVTTASVDQGGDLTIAFGEDRLVVPCDAMYEAWQLRSDKGLLIVSMPGGGLAIWQPDGPEKP